MIVTTLQWARRGGFFSYAVRALKTPVVLLALCVLSTGCGMHFRRHNIDGSVPRVGIAADEGLVFEPAAKPPKQLYVKSTRVLPQLALDLTPEVQQELERFMTRERGTVTDILSKGVDKFGPMAKVLEEAGVPPQLVSVAAVESGLNARAASPAGARGMWQFMKSTARVYGLKVERGRDDRVDFKRSTEAAAQHLRDLFLAFQDWHLALAAYNAGRGAINRLMNRTGGEDFWELARGGHLPGETKRFVPKVIALTLIVNNPDQYGFEGFKALG